MYLLTHGASQYGNYYGNTIWKDEFRPIYMEIKYYYYLPNFLDFQIFLKIM